MTSPTAATGPLPAADATEIRALLGRVQGGFNSNTADVTSSIFTDDGVTITPPGAVVRGRDDLREYQTGRLAGPAADWEIAIEVEELTRLSDDVVLAHVRQDMTIPGGSFSNVGTVVVVRREGAWLVARYHNSRILDSARGTAA